jgi:hypothetical protein
MQIFAVIRICWAAMLIQMEFDDYDGLQNPHALAHSASSEVKVAVYRSLRLCGEFAEPVFCSTRARAGKEIPSPTHVNSQIDLHIGQIIAAAGADEAV